MKNPREALGDACGIPKDISLDQPRMIISGNKELYIENYKALLSYDSSSIVVGRRHFGIVVSGKDLEIKSIRRDDILITGEILHIEYKI